MTVADRLRSSTALATAADFQPPRNLKNEIEATLRSCLNQSFGEWLKTALLEDSIIEQRFDEWAKTPMSDEDKAQFDKTITDIAHDAEYF